MTGDVGMLGCTPAAHTDQHPWPPSLAGWPPTSMPACQHANSWGCRHAMGYTPAVVMLVCLCCWFASQHASMPTTGGAGMLGCMPTAQTCQHFSPPPSLADHRPACQHANMPTTGDAGMLGCTPVAQIDQHSCPPPSLAGHQPACQHASMPTTGVLVC